MWSLRGVLAGDVMVLSLLAAARPPMTPEEQEAFRIGYQIGVLMVRIIVGVIVGLLPLIVALCRGRRTFAFAGWASCVAATFLLGIFFSIPLAVTLTVVVLCLEKPQKRVAVYPQEVEPAQNIDEGAPVRASQVEEPEYAGGPLRPR